MLGLNTMQLESTEKEICLYYDGQQPSLVKKFSTLLPALLLGVDPEDAKRDEGETATAEVLRNSYLPGDGSLSPDAIPQMIQLFTDVHFLSPIDQV